MCSYNRRVCKESAFTVIGMSPYRSVEDLNETRLLRICGLLYWSDDLSNHGRTKRELRETD